MKYPCVFIQKVHEISAETGEYRCRLLGDHFNNTEAQYQLRVPPGYWYAKELLDKASYALYSAVVIPGG